jgi:hypothetical protein
MKSVEYRRDDGALPPPLRGREQTSVAATTAQKNPARSYKARRIELKRNNLLQDAAAFGARLRELRWKNSAWLATAETIAGWNGFEIRNAGSGRSPVRKRSG